MENCRQYGKWIYRQFWATSPPASLKFQRGYQKGASGANRGFSKKRTAAPLCLSGISAGQQQLGSRAGPSPQCVNAEAPSSALSPFPTFPNRSLIFVNAPAYKYTTALSFRSLQVQVGAMFGQTTFFRRLLLEPAFAGSGSTIAWHCFSQLAHPASRLTSRPCCTILCSFTLIFANDKTAVEDLDDFLKQIKAISKGLVQEKKAPCEINWKTCSSVLHSETVILLGNKVLNHSKRHGGPYMYACAISTTKVYIFRVHFHQRWKIKKVSGRFVHKNQNFWV